MTHDAQFSVPNR